MKNLFYLIRRRLKLYSEVAVVKTLYWNVRCGHLSLPILLYPDVHFRLGSSARVLHKAGRLKIGCRWDFSRFKQSEFKICEKGVLEINGSFDIYTGCSIDICSGAILSLGRSSIGNNARIAAFSKISIGDDCVISENVTIRDSDNHQIEGASKEMTSPIRIGNRVWICMNTTILKGVTIGDGAVVAASSLVKEDVPPNTLVGGAPARILRTNIRWR